MDYIQNLSRDEMRSIKAGYCSIEVDYTGCGSAVATMQCWANLCRDSEIVPLNQQADCLVDVNHAINYVNTSCGLSMAMIVY